MTPQSNHNSRRSFFLHISSARNSFRNCPADTSEQDIIFPEIKKASITNLHCTHLCLIRYMSGPLGHDYSWLIINLNVRLMLLLSRTNRVVHSNEILYRQKSEMAGKWSITRSYFNHCTVPEFTYYHCTSIDYSVLCEWNTLYFKGTTQYCSTP